MTVHGVLLIPTKGDPLKLLGDRESIAWKCGARPPRAFLSARKDDGWLPGFASACPNALVLAWGGKPVAEGLDRFARCVGARIEDCDVLDPFWHLDAERHGVADGTLVLLDADGHEVTP